MVTGYSYGFYDIFLRLYISEESCKIKREPVNNNIYLFSVSITLGTLIIFGSLSVHEH